MMKIQIGSNRPRMTTVSMFAGHIKTSVSAMSTRLQNSYAFFTGKGTLFKPWQPWALQVIGLDDYLEYIQDSELKSLCQQAILLDEVMHDLNREAGKIIAKYLKVDIETQEDYEKLSRKRYRLRKNKQLPWIDDDDFVTWDSEYQQLMNKVEILGHKIKTKVFQVYGDYLPEEIGDQRAKDLIDDSDGADDEVAVKLLKKALSYGQTGLQAHKAYQSLGNILERKGQYKEAFENYQLALSALKKPSASTLLMLGLTCIKLGESKRGQDYLLQAINTNDEFYGYEAEVQKAKGILNIG